jgi:hypothetical protein
LIKSKTLFVLGAGASMPYGFPLGSELTRTLRSWEEKPQKLATIGITPDVAAKFLDAFSKSRISSIDTFLSMRPEFEAIGKQAIAKILIGCESEKALRSAEAAEDWYELLWNAAIANINDASDLKYNQIRVVTFNYDRSLEHYLQLATENAFGVDPETAYREWSRIQISHVYGLLGDYVYSRQDSGRLYETELSAEDLAAGAGKLRIVPELRDDDPVFNEAREWFDWAERVCILGFGFDPLNIKRLDFASVIKFKKAQELPMPHICATTKGVTRAEYEQRLLDMGIYEITSPFPGGSREMLRENDLLS